jgi:DNA-binding NtrC family response regulator
MVSYEKNHKNKRSDKYRIAIIDDDSSIQKLIQMSIESTLCGVDLVQFGDARETIFELWESSLVEINQLDLLFLDIHLNNETNGLDILEYSKYISKNIPVVLMSSYFSQDHLNEVLKMNKEPILLRKPFAPTEIISTTRQALNI